MQGINVQPDELKSPGQVRDAKNCLPSVSSGMAKESRWILTQPRVRRTDGTWFDLYYSETESYIANISPDGYLRVYDTIYGLPVPVAYQDTPYIPGTGNRYQDLANQPLKPDSQFPNCDIHGFKDAKDQLGPEAIRNYQRRE